MKYFDYLMQRADSLERTLMLGKIESRRRRGKQRMRWLDSITMELKDGTVLQMRQKTRVMSPDKTKVLICYGGMKVDGRTLMIQTRISCWQDLCCFETSAEAIEALQKVSKAIEQGLPLVEL